MANVNAKKLIITGVPSNKTKDDVVRYAWSITQSYPRSVLPSSEYPNAWLVEFAVDTDIELINRNFWVQRKSLPPKLTYFHLPLSSRDHGVAVQPPAAATDILMDDIRASLPPVAPQTKGQAGHEYQISLTDDSSPFIAIIFANDELKNGWKETFIAQVTNGNEEIKTVGNKLVISAGALCQMAKPEWTRAIKERIESHMANSFAQETLQYDLSTVDIVSELIEKINLMKGIYGIEYRINENLQRVYLLGSRHTVALFFSTFPHFVLLKADQGQAAFKASTSTSPKTKRVFLSRNKILFLQHADTDFVSELQKEYGVKIKFQSSSLTSSLSAACITPPPPKKKMKRTVVMAIPKHPDDAFFGSGSDSDNYYVDVDVETETDSSSLESQHEEGDDCKDTNNYVEIESCRCDQFEAIKSRLNQECSDVRLYSFCTKYLPGLASLFQHGGAYDAEHYLAKMRKETQAHIEYKLEEKKATKAQSARASASAASSTENQVIKEIKVGKSTISLEIGDITRTKSDVLVNSTTAKLDLNAGMVSKKLLEIAGAGIQQELKTAHPDGIKTGEIAISSAGNLSPHGLIFHINCATYTNIVDAKNSLETVMDKCMSSVRMYDRKSITFPCIGAGTLKYPSDALAKIMLDYIRYYLELFKFHSPLTVRICVFEKDQHLIDAFEHEFNQYSPKGSPNAKSSDVNRTVREHRARFTVIAKDSNALAKSVKKILQTHFEKDLIIKDSILNDALKTVNNQEITKVSKQFPNCLITAKLSAGLIDLFGPKAEVVNAKLQLVSLIQGVLTTKVAAASQAHWQYLAGTRWNPFSLYINTIIEDCYKRKAGFATFENELKVNAYVDLINYTYIYGGITHQVRRSDLNSNQPGGSFPAHWDPMSGGESLKMVTLRPGSLEYNDVTAEFIATFYPKAKPEITKVERIQNKRLHRQYNTHKENLHDKKVPLNESSLYHGTGDEAANNICKTGFNRSCCGLNGTAYGHGVYFAKFSQHSDIFATRASLTAATNQPQQHISNTAEPTGHVKHMFRTKVLLGESCLGTKHMKVAPPKPNGEPYDSTHDESKQYFVAFHDSQCYPDYLITYIH